MSEQRVLLELEERPRDEIFGPPRPVAYEDLKLRRPDRRQRVWREVDVERLVADDADVRAVWELVGRFDLSRFAGRARTREGEKGRALWDPRVLVSLWIWAYGEGVSSAREIERQCAWRPELQWLCGLETINHHSLSDFRSLHGAALDELFTQILATLSAAGFVRLDQVAVDGTRIRSQASTSSERSRKTIERHLGEARERVRRMKSEAAQEAASEDANQRREAARRRAARERVDRLEQALSEVQTIEAARAKQRQGKRNKKKKRVARVSETEPEARRQRESNGGYATGYNVQLATDQTEKIIVGVLVEAGASDAPHLEPTLADARRRTGVEPRQVAADEGYSTRANLSAMERAGIEYATPVPDERKRSPNAARVSGIAEGFESEAFEYDAERDEYVCPAGKRMRYRRTSRKVNGRAYRQYQTKRSECMKCELRRLCSPQSKAGRTVSRATEDALRERHRAWMESERGREAYARRAETAEFPNARIKERMRLRKFRLRGRAKALTELLWAATAYNVWQWIRLLWRPAESESEATLATA